MKNKEGLFGIIILVIGIIIIFAGVFLYFLIKNTGLTITKGDVVVELGNNENKQDKDIKNNEDNVVQNDMLINNLSQEENLTNTTRE